MANCNRCVIRLQKLVSTMRFPSVCLVALMVRLLCTRMAEARFYSESIARDRLLRDLFTNYDANIRPAPEGQRVDLTTNLDLQHFDFHESDGAFKFHGKLYVSWKDKQLRWSPENYNNITWFHVVSKALWVPDLEIYNNAPDRFLRMRNRGKVLVESSGRAMWAETVEIVVFCSTNLRRWPHDRHSCQLVLGAWTYHGHELDIVGSDPSLTMNFDDSVQKNVEYRIVNYTAVHVAKYYTCCTEPYISMNYRLIIERRAGGLVIFQMPALCVVLLTMAAFVLEPKRGEKLLLHGVSLILIELNLVFFAKNTGRFARNVPLIVIFYSSSFVLVSFATLLSVFALSVSRSKPRAHLPPVLSKIMKSRLGIMLDSFWDCRPKNAEMSSRFQDVKTLEYSNLISSQTCPDVWTRFAVLAERAAFVMYGVLFFILGTVCFL